MTGQALMEEHAHQSELHGRSKLSRAVLTLLSSLLLGALVASRVGLPVSMLDQGRANDAMDERYQETVFPKFRIPTSLAASASKHAGLHAQAEMRRQRREQSLYIPAMYNPMVDPNQEIIDMIEQFQDVVRQLDALERQLKCAANCTANQASPLTGNASFELEYDIVFSNGTASFGSHNNSEDVDACLHNCSIDPIIFRTAEDAEVVISSKMAELRRLEGSLRGKLASRQPALAQSKSNRKQRSAPAAAGAPHGGPGGGSGRRAKVLEQWLRKARSKR